MYIYIQHNMYNIIYVIYICIYMHISIICIYIYNMICIYT